MSCELTNGPYWIAQTNTSVNSYAKTGLLILVMICGAALMVYTFIIEGSVANCGRDLGLNTPIRIIQMLSLLLFVVPLILLFTFNGEASNRAVWVILASLVVLTLANLGAFVTIHIKMNEDPKCADFPVSVYAFLGGLALAVFVLYVFKTRNMFTPTVIDIDWRNAKQVGPIVEKLGKEQASACNLIINPGEPLNAYINYTQKYPNFDAENMLSKIYRASNPGVPYKLPNIIRMFDEMLSDRENAPNLLQKAKNAVTSLPTNVVQGLYNMLTGGGGGDTL